MATMKEHIKAGNTTVAKLKEFAQKERDGAKSCNIFQRRKKISI